MHSVTALRFALFILLVGTSLAADCKRTRMPIASTFEPSDAIWDGKRQVYSYSHTHTHIYIYIYIYTQICNAYANIMEDTNSIYD